MNKGIIYCTKIREEYEGAHMEHMIAEKLLEIALKKEYGINLYNEPRAEGEHGKPFLSYRPSLHYNISHSGKYVVCILADQEVGIDVQIHCRANYERMLRRMVPREPVSYTHLRRILFHGNEHQNPGRTSGNRICVWCRSDQRADLHLSLIHIFPYGRDGTCAECGKAD